MIRRPTVYLLLTLLTAVPAVAQTSLTLSAAIARARAQNLDAAGAEAAEREAAERVTAARAGYWPRVDVVESWQRSNQPVTVFGSLLSQRRFTAADFALGALNHPGALDQVRTAVVVEQSVIDGVARANVAGAHLDREMAAVRRTLVAHDLAARVTDAYGRVLVATATGLSAAAAETSALADRELAGHRRDAGLVTDADVLQIDIAVSQAREQQIVAAADERIARAQLNQLMGDPLGDAFVLDPVGAPATVDLTNLAALEAEALAHRPEVALAALQAQRAGAVQTAARAAFFPQVAVQGGWELNTDARTAPASGWVVGAVARVNLFNGFADAARLGEARELVRRRGLERDQTATTARLEVHVAAARLEAARARVAVGRAAIAQALESRRIIRDRYEAGLADVAALLRAAEAVALAETQQITAQVAVVTETAALTRIVGRP